MTSQAERLLRALLVELNAEFGDGEFMVSEGLELLEVQALLSEMGGKINDSSLGCRLGIAMRRGAIPEFEITKRPKPGTGGLHAWVVREI